MTVTESRGARWRALLSEPVDGASLNVFRVVFGLLMAGGSLRFLYNGWVHSQFGTSPRALSHYGLSWLQPLSERGMYAVEIVACLAALGLAHGRFQRVCAAVFGACFTWVYFSDVTWYLNHAYFISCVSLLLVFVPMNTRTVPRWVVWLLRSQLGCVYFFAGLAKCQSDWLFEAQPLRIWLPANDDFPLLGPLLAVPATAYVMSWAGALFDLTVPFWLSWKKARPYAYAVVVGFHAMTGMLFQIGMFPWLMIASTPVFFDPDWPRRFTWSKWLPTREGTTAPLSALGFAALAVWLGVQVTLPLREYFFPGNRMWTESGFRFAWNVMVMEKNGSLDLRVVDRATGKTSYADLSQYLSRVQLKQASTQPDLILQLAHWVADDARKEGRDVQVFAETHTSLNGRPAQPLIDPAVDLTQVQDDFSPRTWVVPLRE